MTIRTILSLTSFSLRVVLSNFPHVLHRIAPQVRTLSCLSVKISPKLKSIDCSVHNNYSGQTSICWKCGVSVDKVIFCNACKSIQKADLHSNYFALLGVEEKYDLDLKQLNANYRNLQRLLHPDLFSTKDEEEKAISAEYSSLVNKAYATLLHPLNRGIYMLQIRGIQIEEGTVNMSQEFLMDMMERNEEIDELKDVGKIKQLSQFYREILQRLSMDVGSAFNGGDLEKAKEILLKMKYFSNIEMKMRNLRQEFGIVE